MSNLTLEISLHDPTDIGEVKAYCVLSEVSFKIDTGNVYCVFTCWRSQEAYQQGRKPFAALPVVLESDDALKSILHKNADGLKVFCSDLVELLGQPEKKSRIEQNAKQNTAGN